MRVYRNTAAALINDNKQLPMIYRDGKFYAYDGTTEVNFILGENDVYETGGDFEEITSVNTGEEQVEVSIKGNTFYTLSDELAEGVIEWTEVSKPTMVKAIFDIMEATYSGQDMGKREITATIKFPTPIDFKLGDYIEVPMQSLRRDGNRGSVEYERFYIYTEPQCKKIARPMSAGDAFETTVKFYPRQYELSGIQMRDFIQKEANVDQIIYTGFDNVSFYGGAHELLRRIKGCLDQQYKGQNAWNYVLDPSLDEDVNNALERYAFSFSGNSVMDALLKLNDKDFINTTFFINGRTIFVGFKRPFLCAVNTQSAITDNPLQLMYGKTSHLPVNLDHGGLFDITKTVKDEVPITKLFAYGAARNLNRYYCSDRIKSGRYVNKLMLPSFSDDGETDWITSPEGIAKYGIKEGTKNFEDIYPSLRYMTYADIRGIKYCIKIKTSGRADDEWDNGKMDHENSRSHYPVARVQCYKVTPCDGNDGTTVGVNKLVECAPPEDLAVYIHATGKTVKVRLYGSSLSNAEQAKIEAIEKQLAHDKYIPTTDGVTPSIGGDYSNVIPGSCFCVHDNGWVDMDGTIHDDTEREAWFTEDATAINDRDSNFHRIEYVDTFWLTDLYVFDSYTQTNFKRDGYSAWGWPHYNSDSQFPDSLLVNEVVAVEPVVIPDTSDNLSGGRQQHFDIYLRDVGFQIDEQNDFGEMVFVFSTPVVSVLDGILGGREFTIDGGDNINDYQTRVMCAYKEDGTINHDFFDEPGDSGDATVPTRAHLNGAMWRIRLNRNAEDENLNAIGIILPNIDINMKAGDHIVLLDIYMPDIYIRAAEQRLLREAQLFLEKNDKGTVKYAINFDKVRFNQIPNYALQMREGVMLRMVDDDLNIKSSNIVRDIIKYKTPLKNDVQMYQMQSSTSTKNWDLKYTYQSTGPGNHFKDHVMIGHDDSTCQVTLKVKRYSATTSYVGIDLWFGWWGDQVKVTPTNQVETADGDYWIVICNVPQDYYKKLFAYSSPIAVEVHETVLEISYTKVHTQGFVPAVCKDQVFFKAGKYYEVVLRTQEYSYASNKAFFIPDGTHGSGDNIENNDQIFLTASNSDLETYYKVPDYTKTFVRADSADYRYWKWGFYLPDSFNDAGGYYVALKYKDKGDVDYAEICMVSVTEKDMNAQGQEVNYVDFLASNVTIKMTDNTCPASVTTDDDLRERVIENAPEPIYEIQAQIEEQTKASSWAALNNELEKTKIEADQTKRTYEMLANIARDNYQNLLSLKNSIFDPDGTCNETFLQVMMLQVGADSMNYQLDKTIMTPTGVMNNFNVAAKTTGGNQYFMVYDNDFLRHFVYTKGARNAGTWEIPGNFEAELAPEITTDENNNTTTSWPVYYVCIRCKKDDVNDINEHSWICSTRQYAVNESQNTGEDAYWYFNWGILTCPNQDGNYTLMETRGNAYMYGDNIICGKITDIAHNSYFDLTHGNFVLSDGSGSAALEYIDGILTIRGINNLDDPTSILSRLNLLDEIGGENLLYVTEYNSGVLDLTSSTTTIQELTYYSDENNVRTHTYLPAGKYVFSAKGVDTDVEDHDYTYSLKLYAWGRNGGYKTITIPNGDVKNLLLEITEESYIDLRFDIHKPDAAQQSQGYARASQMQLQLGTKSTTFHEYVQHLTDALHGTTEVSGGLVMTNLLLLKDELGKVVAGMSGLTDDGEYEEQIGGQTETVFSEGVTLFAGGTYQDALSQAKGLIDTLPVFLSKSGIGSRLGCFRVLAEDTVGIYDTNKQNRILLKSGNSMSIVMQKWDSTNDEWEDLLIINSDDIDISYDIRTMGRSRNSFTVKPQGSTTSSFLFTFMKDGSHYNRLTVEAGAQCDIDSSMKVWIDAITPFNNFQISGGVYIYATISLAKYNSDGTYTTVASSQVSTLGTANGNTVSWVIPLTGFTNSPYTIPSAGYYCLRCEIDHFVRINGVGGDFTEHMYNDNWKNSSFGAGIRNDIHFSKSSNSNRAIMRIGRNGMLISKDATSYFMVKNDDVNNIDLRFGGLPNQPDSSTPGRIYKSSGYLMIN